MRTAFSKAIIATLLGAAFIASAQASDPLTTSGKAPISEAASSASASSTASFTKKKVSFKNNQFRMAGELYLPKNYETLSKLPAIIISHPAGGVKEQTPSIYAKGLVNKGFIVLTYDASHQGESGGEPRYLENPFDRVEDIRTAVDYLTTLTFVDSNRIGAMGMCAGGGYSVAAATTDRRIKAIAGVSATDAGSAMRDGWDGATPVSEQLKLLEAASAQRTAEANGKPVAYGGYVSNELDRSLPNTMQEAYEYYRTPRAQHPNSANKVMFTSFVPLFTYSSTDRINTLLTQPLLMVAGSKADSVKFSKTFIDLAASKKKELYVIEGATHVDLYDVMKHVEPAIAKLGVFFGENL